jgi:hypothetical protein
VNVGYCKRASSRGAHHVPCHSLWSVIVFVILATTSPLRGMQESWEHGVARATEIATSSPTPRRGEFESSGCTPSFLRQIRSFLVLEQRSAPAIAPLSHPATVVCDSHAKLDFDKTLEKSSWIDTWAAKGCDATDGICECDSSSVLRAACRDKQCVGLAPAEACRSLDANACAASEACAPVYESACCKCSEDGRVGFCTEPCGDDRFVRCEAKADICELGVKKRGSTLGFCEAGLYRSTNDADCGR